MRTHIRLARDLIRLVDALANIALLRASQRRFEEGVGLGEISTGKPWPRRRDLAECTQKLLVQIFVAHAYGLYVNLEF